ncbi:MAG TPA: DUF885 domain-containing protein [Candidatus Aquilonibacter sp.]|jgi:uncharacterized protein (DUF885 family)|nr:DUF885 domain-containing protein [Candidatus Aquilonibacter sp.]
MQLLPVVACVLISSALVAQTSNSSNNASDKFAKLSEEFIHEALALSPSNASQAGYHQYVDPKTGKTVALDALLDDVSTAGMAEQRRAYVQWRERFHTETPLASLGAEDAADWQLIDDQIALNLLELDRIQNYKHNPTFYVELLGGALFQPLTDDYAAKEVRIGDILSRIAATPRFLEQARSQLVNADPIFIKVAVDENDGNIDLIQSTIAAAIPAGSKLKAEFDLVAPPAIETLKSFSSWLQEDLSKRKTDRTWRLGKELYAEKFRLVMETPVTPDQVLVDAEAELKKTRAEMLQIALPLHKQYYPDHDDHASLSPQERENKVIGEVLSKISEDHAQRDDLMRTINDDLAGVRQFIIDKKIVSLKSRDNLKVIPTPPFMRGIYSVAGFHSAPPLDPNAEAQYWVTPIDPTTPADKAESKLREYNNWVLKWLTIHEALPGHYVQAEHANEIQPLTRRLVRGIFGNGAYVEGWAEYIAQVMMQQGFANSDPRYRISYLKVWLRAVGNTVLDVRMQTMGMTDDQAMSFMMNDAFQTRAEAEGKLQRAKLSSTQLPTYYVGTSEWWKLRHAYEAAKGKDFTLAEFHDRALDQGALPVPWLENILLPK